MYMYIHVQQNYTTTCNVHVHCTLYVQYKSIKSRAAMNIRSVRIFARYFGILASGYSFNVCTCAEIEHVKL